MPNFANCKEEFNRRYSKSITFTPLVPVDGKYVGDVTIKDKKGGNNEEYYKWQFIYSLIYSGLFAKDYIGAEVRFPKGNKNSAPLKVDSVIFDDKTWVKHYNDFWAKRESSELEWLNEHILAVIEYKHGDKEIEKIYNGQVKAAMRQKEPFNDYVLGIYYDTERLFLFHRRDGLFLRYDESKNVKGDSSKTGDLSLQYSDPYSFIPSFDELLLRVNKPSTTTRQGRSINDLDAITSRLTITLQNALSDVLRSLDKMGLVSQKGYEILIQIFALKIFDEKNNQKHPSDSLKFYIENDEANFINLTEKGIQDFIKRLQSIWEDAEIEYTVILGESSIDWKDINQVRVIATICAAFQDFSFVKSSKSDIYQMIFYNFANAFTRDESAQFLTPIPLIDFLVQIVNPRKEDTIIDPCCGIGDFLSLSYVNSMEKPNDWKLNDANIYGVDIDPNMIKLATLNMLLNGDGQAKLFMKPDLGSIAWKVCKGNPPAMASLQIDDDTEGKIDWDDRKDNVKLMKFDVCLTNPPFGEDRAFRPQNAYERAIIKQYEMWGVLGGDSIDKGIVFLENACRMLKENGRLGIVLSNSILSIKKYANVRKWLMSVLRIVAIFDLPPNVFAETGVNTSMLIAYKPSPKRLKELKKSDYSVFARDIRNVGYEKRTSKRNVVFNPLYKTDESTFKIAIDSEGEMVVNEEFSSIVREFKEWCASQEEEVSRLFLRED